MATPKGRTLRVRFTDGEFAALDRLAGRLGTDRSTVVRRALRALAERPDGPEGRMTLDEALGLLEARARDGDTRSILRVVDRLDGPGGADDPFASFDVPDAVPDSWGDRPDHTNEDEE